MKRMISLLLAGVLLFAGAFAGTNAVYASTKTTETRAIAIVFDNSGSMYDAGDQAWCRATYAMEVFASMLNQGDTLQIYPMHPITVGANEYTMQNPLQITDSTQASTIREILTKDAGGTPIESITSAVQGVQKIQADKKYTVILTDGGTFSKNGYGLSKDRTKAELDKLFQANASKAMTVMYLGIGSDACVPTTKDSDCFIKRQAVNTADVLSTLTDMCNLIFGRDTLPKNRISGKTMNFDISMNKLIVFVQGNNISDLKIVPESGVNGGTLVSSQQTKYSTKGAADYKSVADTSLQGMIVTYTGCAAGNYAIEYGGTATSVEVYYEPDADLDFIFTDSEGNNVDLNSLYEGEYKMSFGLKDGQTNQLISSDLLGKPHYKGNYFINDKQETFSHDGHSGEVAVVLKMNDTFKADLTVTYLSGYTISKNSSDFGWPEGGVKVLAPPLGKFQTQLTVAQDYILVKELAETPELVVDLTIGGQPLTAEEFDAVTLTTDCGGIAHTVTPKKETSQYLIKFQSSENLDEGGYPIKVVATYLDESGREATSDASSKVTLSHTPLWVKWLIGFLLLLLLILIIWRILRIRVLPSTKILHKRGENYLSVNGREVEGANLSAKRNGKKLVFRATYSGNSFIINVPNIEPGKESYLSKRQIKRSILINPKNVSKVGSINYVDIAGVGFKTDNKGKLLPEDENQKPFTLRNNSTITFDGNVEENGRTKKFHAEIPLTYKKR